ncbi:MAG: Rieske 2Fe-2S domain-containing protein [Planctomycetota bacterium]
MTASYVTVQWNRHKRVYDAVLLTGVLLSIGVFVATGLLVQSGDHAHDPMILLIRAFGVTAILLLHVVLCIGPLARLSDRCKPLLYNRRHLGVTTFAVALLHAALVVLYYGGFGVRMPLLAVLDGGTVFPLLGFFALLILFALAATSHDFWLANLSPRVWKSLHMLVYVAYALVVMHVALGAMWSERSLLYPVLLGLGVVVVGSLHAITGVREWMLDRRGVVGEHWLEVGAVDDIPEDRALVVCPKRGERIAVFRYDGKVSAMSNVCAHQGGPLGEGKIVDGCITCPWHGYQYLPDKGASPPPYSEKIATYRVRIEGRTVMVDSSPLPPGTPVEPARIEEPSDG